ncbi:MAG: iron-sulfur cluster assembly scaffold protein [Planctomycetia bacterium]|nr:iron-sulfur cluster assembly scaffold protein [Planctomycetia bacterium]
MAWEYSDKTKQLFIDAVHGKPGTHLGEVENPDGLGEHGSIACGDSLRFTFRVEKNEDPTKDIITEARYLTFGCTSAIAASEALCVILEARKCTPIEALKITNQDIVDFLEGLPDQKIHCSVMGAEALEAAVCDWAKKRGVDLAELGIRLQEQMEEEEEGRLVCKCFSITEPFLRRKIKELNLRTLAQVTAALKAGGACQNCLHAPGGIQDILDDVWAQERILAGTAAPAAAVPVGPSVQNAPVNMVNTGSVGNAENAPIPLDGGLPIFGQAVPTPVSPAPVTASTPSADGATLSPYQFAKKIESVVENSIRPLLLRDGGDCSIVDIKGNLVYLELHGACATCSSSNVTLKAVVETTLREQVQADIRVIQV